MGFVGVCLLNGIGISLAYQMPEIIGNSLLRIAISN